MVGIIIASHGEFANGILQSAEMIFGKQQDVSACTLMPSEGPEDIRKKMEDAIASFENQDEVLFLVDLWGGTPFNQANGLIAGHEDKWAIVTGLNLPMLIETYASRMSMEKAPEIAAHVLETSWDQLCSLYCGMFFVLPLSGIQKNLVIKWEPKSQKTCLVVY